MMNATPTKETERMTINGLTKYRIRFTANSETITWERFGRTMEGTLSLAKKACTREYGSDWKSISICGPQGDSGVYYF